MIKKGLESVNDTKVFTFVWTEMHTKNIFKSWLYFFFIRRKAVRSTIGHNRTRIFISVSFFFIIKVEKGKCWERNHPEESSTPVPAMFQV